MPFLRAFCLLLVATLFPGMATAQQADAPIQQLLQQHGEIIAKSSRRTIGPAIDALASSGLPRAQVVLQRWQKKEMWRNKETGLFVFAEEIDRDTLQIFDVADDTDLGAVPDDDFKQLKPNSGIRGLIGGALVQFQLSDPNRANRLTALNAIEGLLHGFVLRHAEIAVDTDRETALGRLQPHYQEILSSRFGSSMETVW